MSMLLLVGAITVLSLVALFLAWRQLDLRIRSVGEDRCLERRVEELALEQEKLRSRVEALEAIAAEES